jgi:DNA-binding CsgD family transcriptional regulator
VNERDIETSPLGEALQAVPGPDLAASLDAVAARLPLAAGVEAATIRVLEQGSDRLHLLAATGMPSRDVRRVALDLLTIPQVRSILAVGAAHTLARRLGLVWLRGEWLTQRGETIGVVIVGSRTERRPHREQLELLRHVAGRLSQALAGVDRSGTELRPASLAFLRTLVVATPTEENGLLAGLRPREQTILELFADGLSASRTHLKLAYRRLGVHSRDEATALVRRDQLLTLL